MGTDARVFVAAEAERVYAAIDHDALGITQAAGGVPPVLGKLLLLT